MDSVRENTWKCVTFLAAMDEQTEGVVSLPKKSRFAVIVLLCFCFISFVFLYTNSAAPATKTRHIDDLRKLWHLGEYGSHNHGGEEKSKSPANITSAQTSTYRFGDSTGIVMQEGSTLKLVIEARDWAGRRTTRGGDMWYATLNSASPRASTSGRVTDNGDGTYDVSFHAGWQGVARIDIILVHPKEACSFVEKTVWPAEDRIVWQGTYRQKTAAAPKPRTHVATCVLRRNVSDSLNKCEYWYPSQVGNTMFICGRPNDGVKWTCDDLYSLGILKERIAVAARELLEGKEYLFHGENVMQIVEKGPKYIQIEGAANEKPAAFPLCRPGVPTPDVEGYWLNDDWHSLRCRSSQWDANGDIPHDASTRCFRGKEVYFLGDTTSREWFETFQEAIGFKFFLRNDDAHYRFVRRYQEQNLSVVYQAHPLLMISAQVPFDEVEYEADVLDRLANKGCNYVVLLSPWSYTNWDRASFVELLTLQKEAVVRFMKRCPKAKVVVSGPHPVAHGTSESSNYADNILLQGIRGLIAQTFRGTKASFLDVWDMSLAYPSRNNRNMPAEVNKQWVRLFLSYVC